MKSNIATAAFLLLFILIFAFGLNSCSDGMAQDRLEYTEKDFDAEISGTLDGQRIEAILRNRPSAENGECIRTLTFTFPESLRGMILSCSNEEENEIRLGDLIIKDIDTSGLWQPFFPFFGTSEMLSTETDRNGNTVISVCDENCDVKYVFSQDSDYPKRIFGKVGDRKIDLSVKSLNFKDHIR